MIIYHNDYKLIYENFKYIVVQSVWDSIDQVYDKYQFETYDVNNIKGDFPELYNLFIIKQRKEKLKKIYEKNI